MTSLWWLKTIGSIALMALAYLTGHFETGKGRVETTPGCAHHVMVQPASEPESITP